MIVAIAISNLDSSARRWKDPKTREWNSHITEHIVSCSQHLNYDQEYTQRHRHESIDERAVETNDGDERRTGRADNDGLPSIVVYRSSHKDVQLLGSLVYGHLVVNDLSISLLPHTKKQRRVGGSRLTFQYR